MGALAAQLRSSAAASTSLAAMPLATPGALQALSRQACLRRLRAASRLAAAAAATGLGPGRPRVDAAEPILVGVVPLPAADALLHASACSALICCCAPKAAAPLLPSLGGWLVQMLWGSLQ